MHIIEPILSRERLLSIFHRIADARDFNGRLLVTIDLRFFVERNFKKQTKNSLKFSINVYLFSTKER